MSLNEEFISGCTNISGKNPKGSIIELCATLIHLLKASRTMKTLVTTNHHAKRCLTYGRILFTSHNSIQNLYGYIPIFQEQKIGIVSYPRGYKKDSTSFKIQNVEDYDASAPQTHMTLILDIPTQYSFSEFEYHWLIDISSEYKQCIKLNAGFGVTVGSLCYNHCPHELFAADDTDLIFKIVGTDRLVRRETVRITVYILLKDQNNA